MRASEVTVIAKLGISMIPRDISHSHDDSATKCYGASTVLTILREKIQRRILDRIHVDESPGEW